MTLTAANTFPTGDPPTNYGHTYAYPYYPDMSGIEDKLDKIIQLLSSDAIKEIEQENKDLRESLDEVISKYDDILKELAEL